MNLEKSQLQKSWDFFLQIFDNSHFTFYLSEFPSQKNENSDQNSITKSPYFLRNFDL